MRSLLGAVSFIALSAAATGATAQEWYGAVDLGWHSNTSDLWESEFDKPSGVTAKWDFETDDNFAAFGRVGTRFRDNWRVEVELGYREEEITEVFGRTFAADPRGLCYSGQIGLGCDKPGGSFDSWTLMANVLYDFMPDSSFNPFVGVGAGFSRLEADIDGTLSGNGGVGPAFQHVSIHDKDLGWAAQAIAGFSWAATDRINLDLTYRYLWADHDIRVDYETVGGLNLGDFDGDKFDHSVTLGLRYSFGAVAAPPPPPPSIEQREFIVYFPFDQYVLTPEAQAVVQEAAAYSAQGNAARVVVTGHADTSGSAAYNIRLSERRAKAVADALVGMGVNGSSMAVDWKGESQPAVATGDGVKEPLNRRATIDIQP